MSCNVCGHQRLNALIDFGAHPIAHRFLVAPSDSEYVHAAILEHCPHCDHLQQRDPVPPEKLYTEYVCLSSWKNHPHLGRVLDLIEGVLQVPRNARIVEVGSNDGSFLEALSRRGYTNLLGIEPSLDGQAAARNRGVQTVGAYFDTATATAVRQAGGPADLIISRHVLEHVSNLPEFGRAMQILLAPGGQALIEVPDFSLSLSARDYSAIWEEHVNYYSPETLERLLASWGLAVFHRETAVFSGQALIMLAREVSNPVQAATAMPEGYRALIRAYRDDWPGFRRAFQQFLGAYRDSGKKTAVYGAGSRGCSFVNFLGLAPFLECFFDDQPEKQGKYMPGSRLPIQPGSNLDDSDISLCLLAVNAENESKVAEKHLAFLARGGELVSVCPPSSRLPAMWASPQRQSR